MTPLVKKILEAGLVDANTVKLMERWGHLESGASELVGKKQVTAQTLEEFAEDIAELVDKDPELRETRLDIDAKCQTLFSLVEEHEPSVIAYVDQMDRLIVPVRGMLRGLHRGSLFYVVSLKDGEWKEYEAQEVEPLFGGDKIVALQVTVQGEFSII